eukprot:m.319950 g.319950  ORF g.319950 m.319950 type:complete len:87 (+) comp16517_c0_seq110:458-718(+)
MVSLRVLNAGSNELDTVTESIGLLLHTGMLVKLLLFFYFSGRLARLSQLQLQHNNIKSVPSAIYNLVVLAEFCNRCKIHPHDAPEP